MKRLVGLSSQQLETREGVMEGLARNGIRAAFGAVSLGSLLTAAVGPTPEISTTAASEGITTLAPVELSAAPDAWSDYVEAVLYPFLVETYSAAAQQTWSFVGDTLKVDVPQVTPLTAEDYLRAAVNRLKNVGNLIWTSIKDTLAEGYAAGETTHQLAARVRAVASDVSAKRALVIARTEVISAANAASLAQVQLGGFTDLECSKRWLATDDEHTREEHRLADGQTVGLSESFFVGGEFLQVPGDPNGRADNVIQCRCTVEFVFADDAEPDPDPLVAADAPGDLNWTGWNKANPEHPKDSKGKWTATPDGLTIPKWSQMKPHEIEEWYDKITPEQWAETPDNVKKALQSHSTLFFGYHSPKNKIKNLTADEQAATQKSTASTPAVKKAAAPAVKAPVGKPLHVNTNVIYKQTYKDKAAVAYKPGDASTGGVASRLIWDADKKKFALQAQTENGGWVTVETYGKGAAYQKFSKETGWQTPDSEPPVAVPVAVPDDDEGPFKSVTNMSPTGFVDWFIKNFHEVSVGDGKQIWDSLDESEREKIYAKAQYASNTGQGNAPLSQINKWGYKPTAKPKVLKSAAPTTPSLPPLSLDLTQKFAHGTLIAERKGTYHATSRIIWDDNAGQFVRQLKMGKVGSDWQVVDTYDVAGLEAFLASSKASWKLSDGKTSTLAPTKPSSGTKTLADLGFDAQHATSPVVFDAWFAKNLTGKKDVWDQLSANAKKLVEAAAYNATMFGYDKPSVVISNWHDIDASGDPSAALIDKVKGMTNGEFQVWFSDPKHIDQDTWNSLSDEAKQAINDKVNTLTKMGWPDAQAYLLTLKKNEPDYPAPPKKVPSSITVDDSDVSGPDGMTPAFNDQGQQVAWVKYTPDGSGAFLYEVDPSTGGEGQYTGAVDFDDGQSLEEEIQNLLDGGFLSAHGTSAKSPLATPPPPPAPHVPPAPKLPPPHGYTQHLVAHASVKFVGDIGQPEVGVKTFKSTNAADMKKTQHDMLLLSDKKKWTPDETSAVSFYTTSTGYQSMNGVLRNDETRLKKFSEPQLSQAAQSAALLQSAMTPLTENLLLHRGTGAQQFGFKTMKVSTDKLKKLEGITITDRGFVSTSVVPPTAISYDYAKKPIKVVVQAPKGTPAVYVSSATPGYSHENELILGAGSSFHVTEVRAATAADKALYGDHTEQVVTLTVVPATKTGPKDISGKTTPSASAAVTVTAPPSLKPLASPALNPTPTLKSTPTLGGSSGGVPIKIATNAIYKTSYTDGAVIAERVNSSGAHERIVWNEGKKKFLLQQSDGFGGWITNAELGKGDAYKKFKDDTDWTTPISGNSALGTPGFGPKISTTAPLTYDHITPGLKLGDYVKVSDGNVGKFISLPSADTMNIELPSGKLYEVDTADVLGVVPAPGSVTPPTSKVVPGKAPKFDAAQLQAMHGTPPNLSDTQKNYIWQNFKYGGTPTTINSTPANIFKKLHKAVESHNSNYPLDKLNLLQALKLIDERAAKYSASGNQNLYEKKIVEWLQTPSGKNTATKVIDPGSAPSATKPLSSTAPTSLKGLLAKVKDPSELGSAHTKVATFKTLSDAEAKAIQAKMTVADPLTSTQRAGLRRYTTGAYKEINGVLRGSLTGDTSEYLSAARSAKNAQEGMRPIEEDVLTFRKTGAAQFPGLSDYAKFADIKKFEGQVFQDKGFLSTSIEKNTWSGNVHLEVEVPKGTPAAYVGGYGNISAHPHEFELLLAAGLRYRVLKVEPMGSSGAKVRLRVEP